MYKAVQISNNVRIVELAHYAYLGETFISLALVLLKDVDSLESNLQLICIDCPINNTELAPSNRFLQSIAAQLLLH